MPPTSTPRTAVHTSDLSPDDFGVLAGKIVSITGLAGPFQLLSGTIDDYENQSQKPELVWFGGTEEDPFCIWISYPSGSYLKIKWPTPSEAGFCQSVVDCILADLERGAGAPDKYRIPEMVGPTWRIVTVVYGDANTEVSFAADTGTDLVSLIAALNASANLPEDWYWEILTGALALCVPHGTGVTQVVLDGGTEVDFTVPTVIGTPESRLGTGITITPSITGNGAAVGSAHDTEAEVEAQFALMQNVTVRWEDADGDPRVSYKDPANGWYHQADKFFTPVLISTGSRVKASTANVTVDLTSHGVPENARFAYVRVNLNGSAKYDTSDRLYAAEVNVDSPTFASPTSGAIRGVTAAIRMRPVTTGTETDYADATIQGKVKLDGSGDLLIEFGGNDDISLASAINVTNIYTVHLLGWSR